MLEIPRYFQVRHANVWDFLECRSQSKGSSCLGINVVLLSGKSLNLSVTNMNFSLYIQNSKFIIYCFLTQNSPEETNYGHFCYQYLYQSGKQSHCENYRNKVFII